MGCGPRRQGIMRLWTDDYHDLASPSRPMAETPDQHDLRTAQIVCWTLGGYAVVLCVVVVWVSLTY